MGSPSDLGLFIFFVIILAAQTLGAILAIRWFASWLLGRREQ